MHGVICSNIKNVYKLYKAQIHVPDLSEQHRHTLIFAAEDLLRRSIW